MTFSNNFSHKVKILAFFIIMTELLPCHRKVYLLTLVLKLYDLF